MTEPFVFEHFEVNLYNYPNLINKNIPEKAVVKTCWVEFLKI